MIVEVVRVMQHFHSPLSTLCCSLLNTGELLHAPWYHSSGLADDFRWWRNGVRTVPAYPVPKQQKDLRFFGKAILTTAYIESVVAACFVCVPRHLSFHREERHRLAQRRSRPAVRLASASSAYRTQNRFRTRDSRAGAYVLFTLFAFL